MAITLPQFGFARSASSAPAGSPAHSHPSAPTPHRWQIMREHDKPKGNHPEADNRQKPENAANQQHNTQRDSQQATLRQMNMPGTKTNPVAHLLLHGTLVGKEQVHGRSLRSLNRRFHIGVNMSLLSFLGHILGSLQFILIKGLATTKFFCYTATHTTHVDRSPVAQW